jgi:hypothetical protein
MLSQIRTVVMKPFAEAQNDKVNESKFTTTPSPVRRDPSSAFERSGWAFI